MSNSKQIRVCQVLHGIVGGGSEQVVLNYCSRMRDIHFDLLYQYEPNPQILERFNEAGINCIQVPDKVHHPLKHLWTMFKLFRKGHYDVVHCHLDWYMNSYVCLLAMLAGIKKRIAHHHQAYSISSDCHLGHNSSGCYPGLRAGISGSSFRALTRNFLCSIFRIPCKLFATHWLACGKAAAINGWGKSAVEKGNVTILPNAIDPERFKFNEKARCGIRARYGIKKDDFVIGHVGRFYPQKNHEFLIDVFAEVRKHKSNARLLLLGEGPLQKKIRQKVETLGLAETVVFAGLQKDPAPFYSAMDVFAFPSLWEGLPLTLVEAQYNGLQCILSSSISKEIVILPNIQYMPIDDMECWTQGLLKKNDNNGHVNTISLEKGCFDIKQSSVLLMKIYCG